MVVETLLHALSNIYGWFIFFTEHWQGTVATLAFFVATSQMWLQRNHTRLSVRPYLDTYYNIENAIAGSGAIISTTINFTVINNGLGTAIIESFIVKHSNATVTDSELLPLQNHLSNLLAGARYNISCNILFRNSTLRAEGHMVILSIQLHLSPSDDRNDLVERLAQYKVEVRYKSMYGDRCPPLIRESILS